MSLYVILIIQGTSLRCLSHQQLVLELIVVYGKGGKVIEVPFAVRVGMKCVFLNPVGGGRLRIRNYPMGST